MGGARPGEGWLLTEEQARRLVDAWRDSDTCGEHASDLSRASIYSPLGLFVTALHMEHEVALSEWEAVGHTGGGPFERFSTADMPFDFAVTVIE